MRNCHKRWKREQKEKREALAKSAEKSKKGLDKMIKFMQEHPEEALKQMEEFQNSNKEKNDES